MRMKSVFTAAAIFLGGASLLTGGKALAQTLAEPVASVDDAHQNQNFVRQRDSAKALNLALKRLAEQYRIDQIGFVNLADQKIMAAQAAADDGNMLEARLKLDEVYITTRAAIISMMHSPAVLQRTTLQPARMTQSSQARQQADFRARVDSTRALATALKRIADEKRDVQASSGLALIEPVLREAEALALNDRLPQGRALADQAYCRVKDQIVRLRDGETLVQSLHFANKQDEYRYEIDRNEAFRMMIPMLVPAELSADAALNMHLVDAVRLRNDADVMAAHQQFDDAIRIIEAASEAYLEAFRHAGTSIPG